jgi:hypothetical protein
MRLSSTYDGSIAGRLAHYQDLARREGQLQRPPGDSTSLDQHESQLKVDAESFLSTNDTALTASLSAITKSLADLRQEVIVARANCDKELLDDLLGAHVDADLAEQKDDLVEVVRARMQRESDLNAFRAQHGIMEQAVFPESRPHHLGVIVVLALLETVANAVFYENEQGLLGGWVTALGVSSLSMASSVILGHLATYKNLRPLEEKLKGYLAITFFLFMLLFLNSLFAHFRSEYQQIETLEATALSSAFQSALRSAFGIFQLSLGFKDFLSFILFGLGILLMCVAFWKGYRLDDRYPGHGDRFRAYRKFLDAERGAIAKVRSRISTRIQQKQQTLQSLLSRPSQLASLVASRQADLATACNQYSAAQESVTRDFAMVLNAYRQANVSIRATTPPSYFSDTPRLASLDSTVIIREINSNLMALSSGIDSLRGDFQQALQNRLQDTISSGAMLMNVRLAEYSADVTRAAEERINQSIQVLGRQS